MIAIRSMFSFLTLIAIAATSVLLLVTPAQAASCKAKVVIEDFSGRGSAQVRTAVIRTLEAQGCTTVPSSEAEQTAEAFGVKLGSPEGYVIVAEELGVTVFISGSVKKSGRKWLAEVSVQNGGDGELIKSTSWSSAKPTTLSKLVQRTAWQRLNKAIARGKLPKESRNKGKLGAAQSEASAPASSDKDSKRVAILELEGSEGSTVRKAIAKELEKEGHQVVDNDTVDESREKLGPALQDNEGYVQLARELDADAIVTGSVVKRGRGYKVTSEARNGQNGEVLGDASSSARRKNGLPSAGENVAGKLIPTLQQAQRPEAVKVVEENRDEEDEEDDSGPNGALTYVALDANVGLRFFSRSLSYNDDLRNALRAYSVAPGFAIAVGGDWFPGAHFTDGFAAHLGLNFDFHTSLGLNSTVSGQANEFPTTALAYSFGLIGRLPFDDLMLHLRANYGSQSFEIEDANATTPRPDIANVAYSYIRAGVDARYQLSERFALLGGLGYRFVLSAGEIEDTYFPNISVGAIDANLGLALRLFAGLEARLNLDMQRYFMSMNPEPGDTYIAGGAVDQYFGGTLGIAYRIGGPDLAE